MLRSWAYVRGPGCSSRYEALKAWAKASPYARSLRALCVSYWDFPFGLRQENPGGAPHSGHATENAPLICRSSPGSFLGTHAAPSHVAVFAHMVPSITPGRVSARLCKLLHHYPLPQDVGLGLGHGSAESWNVP